MKKKNENQLFAEISKNPRYKGKQVVVVANEAHILSTKSKAQREKLLMSLVNKYPNLTPIITFIPRENALILLA